MLASAFDRLRAYPLRKRLWCWRFLPIFGGGAQKALSWARQRKRRCGRDRQVSANP